MLRNSFERSKGTRFLYPTLLTIALLNSTLPETEKHHHRENNCLCQSCSVVDFKKKTTPKKTSTTEKEKD